MEVTFKRGMAKFPTRNLLFSELLRQFIVAILQRLQLQGNFGKLPARSQYVIVFTYLYYRSVTCTTTTILHSAIQHGSGSLNSVTSSRRSSPPREKHIGSIEDENESQGIYTIGSSKLTHHLRTKISLLLVFVPWIYALPNGPDLLPEFSLLS